MTTRTEEARPPDHMPRSVVDPCELNPDCLAHLGSAGHASIEFHQRRLQSQQARFLIWHLTHQGFFPDDFVHDLQEIEAFKAVSR